MKKIEDMLNNPHYTEHELSHLFWINYTYEQRKMNKKNTNLEFYQKQYESYMPISSVLILDPIIKNRYDEIQSVDTTSFYHGIEHIKNVMLIMRKFITSLEIDQKTSDELLTAIIFHDIGRTNVGKDHDKKSASYFIDYIRNNPDNMELISSNFSSFSIERITRAILFHEQKNNLDVLTPFELLVNLADKLDITKKRVNMNGILDDNNPASFYREIYLDVDDVVISKEDNTLKIDIVGNENLSSDRLFSIPFMNNMKNVLVAFSDSMGMNYKLFVNGEISYNSDSKVKKEKK